MESKPVGRDSLARILTLSAIALALAALFIPSGYFPSLLGDAPGVCVDGKDGTNGVDGKDGANGVDGKDGTNGVDGKCTIGKIGPAGAPGLSAYEVWLGENPGKTIEEYFAALRGEQGVQGIPGIDGAQGIQGEMGPAGPAGTDGASGFGSFGAFYDETIQVNPVANGANVMLFGKTDQSATSGISVVDGSKLTFTKAGVYNVAFSAQLDKTDSGADKASIWLSKNGNDVAWTATTVDVNDNNAKVVAAWNFFVSVNAGDYIQLKWSSADVNLRLFAQPSNGMPGIPSVILTANQVG